MFGPTRSPIDFGVSVGHTTANGTATSLTIDEGDTLTIDAVITRDPAPWGANLVNYQLQFFDGGWDNVGTPEGSSDFARGVSDLGDAGLWRIIVIDTVTSREYPLRAVVVNVSVWLLTGGVWSDTSIWNDSAIWIDA